MFFIKSDTLPFLSKARSRAFLISGKEECHKRRGTESTFVYF